MYEYCKHFVEDCYDGQGSPCKFYDMKGDHWCHKDLVEYYLEKVFNINKNRPSLKISYLVDSPTQFEKTDGLVLRKLGHDVTIQKKTNNFLEDLRRADVLADFVYVEKDEYTQNMLLPLRPKKNINAAGVDLHIHTDCRNLGLINFLSFNENQLYGKKVLVYGNDLDLVKKLMACGASVFLSEQMTMESRNFDLIIALERDKTLNCYPIHIPVIDVAKCCIHTEGREVVQDCHWFNVLGVLEQLW